MRRVARLPIVLLALVVQPVAADFLGATVIANAVDGPPGTTTYRILLDFDDATPLDQLLIVEGLPGPGPLDFCTNTVLVNAGGLDAGTRAEDFPSATAEAWDTWVTLGTKEPSDDLRFTPWFLGAGDLCKIRGSTWTAYDGGWYDSTLDSGVMGGSVLIAQFTVLDDALGGPGHVRLEGFAEYWEDGPSGPQRIAHFLGESAPFGACCLADDLCMELSRDDCISAGGAYRGDGHVCGQSTCFPVGACCFPDGTCTQVNEPECVSMGGVFQGPDTLCLPGLCPARVFDRVIAVDVTAALDPPPPAGLRVTRLYATGPHVTADFPLMRVDAITPITATSGTTWYQHPAGGVTSPSPATVSTFPDVAFDTFVTFNCLTNEDDDCSATSVVLTPTTLEGVWLLAAPFAAQGAPLDDVAAFTDVPAGVLIAQITTVGPAGYEGTVDLRTRLSPTEAIKIDDVLVRFPPLCAGDVDDDGSIGVSDLIAVIVAWGDEDVTNRADVNSDGVVDVDDLVAVIAGWGACP